MSYGLFPHGHIYEESSFASVLGRSLGVIECVLQGLTMHQDVDVLVFIIYDQK